MKIISWNIAGRIAPWHRLLEVGADIALLQEAAAPPPEVAARIDADPAPWDTPGVDAQRKWRTAVVRLSERVQVDWIEAKPLLDAGWGEFTVSRPGTIAAAKVTPADGEPGEPLWLFPCTGCGRALMPPPATVGLSPPTQSTVPFPTCRPSSEASKASHTHRRRPQHPLRVRRSWQHLLGRPL